MIFDKFLNKKIGDILILRRNNEIRPNSTKKRVSVVCLCPICKKEFVASFENLRTGHYKSCGCAKKLLNKKHQKWRGVGEISLSFFHAIRNSASVRKKTFSLTIDYLWNLFLKQNRKCALSGMDLSFPKNRRDFCCTASLDRIDASHDYTEDNVQWVHKDVNYAKQQMNNNQFLNLVKSIYEYKISN